VTNYPQTWSRSIETDCPRSSLTHQQCTSQERCSLDYRSINIAAAVLETLHLRSTSHAWVHTFVAPQLLAHGNLCDTDPLNTKTKRRFSHAGLLQIIQNQGKYLIRWHQDQSDNSSTVCHQYHDPISSDFKPNIYCRDESGWLYNRFEYSESTATSSESQSLQEQSGRGTAGLPRVVGKQTLECSQIVFASLWNVVLWYCQLLLQK